MRSRITQITLIARIIIGIVILLSVDANAQEVDSSSTQEKSWNISTDLNAYFLKDDFFLLPVLKADHKWLHLEARYNYEDLNTFSGWAGYNIEGGNELEYFITPMFGVVAGDTKGFAPGLEITFDYSNFSFYTESEYLFDSDDKENNFFYAWSELSYTMHDKIWFGASAQRTRLYQTDLEINGGVFSGGSIGNWEINAYLFNVFIDEPFAILAVSYAF